MTTEVAALEEQALQAAQVHLLLALSRVFRTKVTVERDKNLAGLWVMGDRCPTFIVAAAVRADRSGLDWMAGPYYPEDPERSANEGHACPTLDQLAGWIAITWANVLVVHAGGGL